MNYKQLIELDGYINLWEVIPEDKHSKLANQICEALDEDDNLLIFDRDRTPNEITLNVEWID